MTTKNEDLIKRVRDALKIDLREMDAILTPLLTDVLAALERHHPAEGDLSRPAAPGIQPGLPTRDPIHDHDPLFFERVMIPSLEIVYLRYSY